MATTSQIIARRIGRITFGSVLLLGVARLVAASWSGGLTHHTMYSGHGLDAASLIGLIWFAAAIAGVIAWRAAHHLRLPGNAETLFAESLMIPAAGVALVLPLTLHLPVVVALADRETFDAWVWLSIWITGLAHVVFAFTSALRGYRLVAGKPAWSPLMIYTVTVVTSCLPFIVLYAIPPALVAITALPFIPLLRAMEGIVRRERALLAAAPGELPRAVAAISRRAP